MTTMDSTLDITLCLAIALLLGGIIGIEREYRSKDVGFRPHFLVGIGSALFCIVSQYGFGYDLKDSSRVAAQVVSGIGFLGARTIIFQKNMVRGFTTAARLWVTVAIGLAYGTGMFAAVGITTVMVLVGLELLNTLIPQIGTSSVSPSFTTTSREGVQKAVARLRKECPELHNIELRERHTSNGTFFEVSVEMKVRRGTRSEYFLECLDDCGDVTISSME